MHEVNRKKKKKNSRTGNKSPLSTEVLFQHLVQMRRQIRHHSLEIYISEGILTPPVPFAIGSAMVSIFVGEPKIPAKYLIWL